MPNPKKMTTSGRRERTIGSRRRTGLSASGTRLVMRWTSLLFLTGRRKTESGLISSTEWYAAPSMRSTFK